MSDTIARLSAGILEMALQDGQVMDALGADGLGACLGGLWAKAEPEERRRMREKATPVPVEKMGKGWYRGWCPSSYDSCSGLVEVPFGGITDDGLPVPVTKEMSPYAYSTFVTYDDGSGLGDPRTKNPGIVVLSSDKLIRHEKYNKLSQKHFGGKGHYWNQRGAPEVQAFLREILDAPELRLHRILEGCHAASGYPFWLFKITGGNAE